MAMATNLKNISQNVDFYLELSPSNEKRETGSTQFNQDGSPFNHNKILKRKLRKELGKSLLWRFKNFCLDYQYYFPQTPFKTLI